MEPEYLSLHCPKDPSSFPSEGGSVSLELANIIQDISDNLNGNDSSSNDSDSDSADSEKESTRETKSYTFLGKRKRSCPVKYSSEFSIKKTKASPKKSPAEYVKTMKRRRPILFAGSLILPKKPRGSRCGKCEGCLRSDCGKCVYCLDKPKYGGPGRKKQRCAKRSCSNFERRGYFNHSNSSGSANVGGASNIKKDESTKDPASPKVGTPKLESTTDIASVKMITPTIMKLSETNVSSTPVSLISMLSTKDTETVTQAGQEITPSKQLVNVKQALNTSQLSYSKVAQLVTTTQLICDQLKHDSPNPKTTEQSSSSGISTIPMVPVIPALSNGTFKLSPSSASVANTQMTMVLTKPLTATRLSTSPRPITITKVATHSSGVDSGAPVSTSVVSTSALLASNDSRPPPPLIRTSFSQMERSTSSSTPSPDEKTRKKMVCIQCGRERTLGVARSSKFCTQRCIISWMEANPEKTPKVAMGEDDPPPGKQVSPKPLPRALKNLQIDMAKPGTKLAPSESESENDEEDDEVPSTTEPTAQNVTGLIPSPPSTVNSTSPTHSDPKVTPGATKTSSKLPAKGTVKRSTNTPQIVTTKKQKMSTPTSQKSVSFNLDSAGDDASSTASSTPLTLRLDKIASYLRPKIANEVKIKIPHGLPSDIRKWTVSQVVEYFKSTADCHSYVDLFETQEVDGIALLLLTHEALVKCLGIKLGRAVKIMNRVTELKLYHDSHTRSNN